MDATARRLIGEVAAYLDRPRPLLLWVAFAGVLVVFAAVWPWDIETIRAPFSPQAGRHAVPAQVRAMRELAGVHGITSFRIGADLEADPELWLRAVEYLYPVRLAPEARMVFTRSDTPVMTNCVLVGQSGAISLASCGP